MEEIIQDELPVSKDETFVLDQSIRTVIFSGGFQLEYTHPENILGARLEPDYVIQAAIQHIGIEKTNRFRLMSILFRPDGVSSTILLGRIRPAVVQPTWQIHFHFRLPPGVMAFPDIYPVFVRDSDGVVWTLEPHAKHSGLVPSYTKEPTQWDNKPQSQRKRKT